MRARRPRFYNLRRTRVRQSWNKYNLYNLATLWQRNTINKTFFQQKWIAKSQTRAYHGPHIRERDWARMFSRRALSTVDLDPSYLATYDGTEQSSGRGSGKQIDPKNRGAEVNAANYSWSEGQRRRAYADRFQLPPEQLRLQLQEVFNQPVRQMTPYMQMTFAPLERRLDTAIFRAMFASSTLQARQFCVHGAVTVNGKKMRYPAYQLNPGDLFQVDPERVLFAAGQPKNPKEVARIAKRLEEQEQRAAAREADVQALRDAKLKKLDAKLQSAGGETPQDAAAAETAVEAEAEVATQDAAADSHLGEDGEPMTEEERQASYKSELKRLVLRAKSILKDKDDMSARQKQRVRLFLAEAKRAVSRAGQASGEPVDAEEADLSREAVMGRLADVLKGMSLDQSATDDAAASESASSAADEAATTTDASPKASVAEIRASLSSEEQKALEALLREDAENPYDESKPYLTPWRPRDFLSPFAFIPRYLEVNQNICAAIYLRHPVARRGYAEVPTPFSHHVNQLAFNWYLRRR